MVFIYILLYLICAGLSFNYAVFKILKFNSLEHFWNDRFSSEHPGWFLFGAFWIVTIPCYFAFILPSKLFTKK